jgi:hypothetical protein
MGPDRLRKQKALRRLSGAAMGSPVESPGFSRGEHVNPEDRAAGAPALELSTALSGEQTQHDRWHVRKDGTRFWGTNTVQPLYDAAGERTSRRFQSHTSAAIPTSM